VSGHLSSSVPFFSFPELWTLVVSLQPHDACLLTNASILVWTQYHNFMWILACRWKCTQVGGMIKSLIFANVITSMWRYWCLHHQETPEAGRDGKDCIILHWYLSLLFLQGSQIN
jgi:hypothetical protein